MTIRHLNLRIKAAVNNVGMRLSGTAVVTKGGGTFSFYLGNPPAQPPTSATWYIGTNLSGIEWGKPSIRYGQVQHNYSYSVPRKHDALYLAHLGFNKIRLPIQWELLQPVLSTRTANATIAAALSANTGTFRGVMQDQITYVLDACRTAGLTCILDLHNYCRYADFSWSTDGSVVGFTDAASASYIMGYTTDNTKVLERIMTLTASTASSITIANFTDFWTRAATLWKDHAGLGGYGLMNEPNNMPAAGGTNGHGSPQDGAIWITFAQAAVSAIRAVDVVTPIYVAGNNYDSVMVLDSATADVNPGLRSVSGAALIFEGHMYLDASSSGASFDWDVEVAKGFSAAESGPITTATGKNRLSIGAAWATSNSFKLALGEIGMPNNDSRWFDSFQNALALAHTNNIEIYTWMGGNHWPIHGYAINHVPQWHQHKTMEPLVSSFVRAEANLTNDSKVFDNSNTGFFSSTGQAASIVVYSRGNLGTALTIGVAVIAGAGTLSTSQLILSAGPAKSITYTYTPTTLEPHLLRYTPAQAGFTIPDRQVYALADPTGYAATNLSAAAHAIMAKYNAAKWNAADAFTDYMNSASACGHGSTVRAISDTGWGSRSGNPLEMIQWINLDMATMGTMTLPTFETVGGTLTRLNFTTADVFGLWCKKATINSTAQPTPVQVVPYHLTDDHFVIAAIGTAATVKTGAIFAAVEVESVKRSELRLNAGRPEVLLHDGTNSHVRTSAVTLSTAQAFVVSMATNANGQTVRVNTTMVASGTSAALTAQNFNAMQLGWAYYDYYSRGSFGGHIYAAVAGKGTPTMSEVAVVERYLGTLAGLTL